ncbi:MAG: helix-turn-helix transcriptional regulator [Lachnospiraceae bacterium]
MLNENIKAVRRSKGLSQEELAVKLNVVRQTISKWEKGLSVPDSEMLVAISDVFEIPVSTLLGETIVTEREDELKIISEKLEIINLQLSQSIRKKRKAVCGALISICLVIVTIFIVLLLAKSPYLAWDYSDPERAVLGVAFHSLEWLFVRSAPFTFVGAMIGIILICKAK